MNGVCEMKKRVNRSLLKISSPVFVLDSEGS